MFGYVNGGTMKLNRAGEIVHAAFLSMDEWYPGVRVDAFQVMPDHVHAIVCLSRRPTTMDATTPVMTIPPATLPVTTIRDATLPVTTIRDATLPVGAGPRACPTRHGCADSPNHARRNDPHPNRRAISESTRDRRSGDRVRSDGANRRPCGVCGVSSRGQARGPAPTGDVASGIVIAGAVASENVVAGDVLSLGDVIQRFKSLTTARYRHGVIRLGWVPFRGRLWQRNYYERIIRDERALNRIRRYIRNNPCNSGGPSRPPRR